MEMTLGKRIAALRRQRQLKQENLADLLGISPQAVSKWENDQTCPDIGLLPKLAEILGVSVDELLSGKKENLTPVVQMVETEQRKSFRDMVLKLVVDSADGDQVKINLPMALVQIAVETGVGMPQMNGKVCPDIAWEQILQMVQQGVVGNLLEVESADGDTVRIFVE